ncbi:MAG: DUF3043 domain-containing protein [Beutenbergiaceae bacterium]
MAAPEPAASAAEPAPQAGKGRPTPKRRQVEAANRKPLISGDPKADRARARAEADKQRQLMDQAMQTGDERHLPLQHRGPGRRYARDYVDSRWTLGEFFLPLALVVVLIMVFGSNIGIPVEFVLFAFYGLYAGLVIMIIESVLLARRVRKNVREKYGDGSLRGLGLYVAMRSMQIRRMRMPKPQVARGEKPS